MYGDPYFWDRGDHPPSSAFPGGRLRSCTATGGLTMNKEGLAVLSHGYTSRKKILDSIFASTPIFLNKWLQPYQEGQPNFWKCSFDAN